MNDDNGLLIARIDDALRLCRADDKPHFVGFLSEGERSAVMLHAQRQHARFSFFGGYEDAERTFFAALPDWADEVVFPIAPITVEYPERYTLCHRDFLGKLMSLGITREKVGDIIISSGCAVVYVAAELEAYLLTELDCISAVGVKVRSGAAILNVEHRFDDIRQTVSSARIDCIVGALCKLSRDKASTFIEQGLVFIDGIECQSVSKRVNEGAVLTIRRVGKFIIDSVSDTTKKGRLVLIARKKI